MCEKLIPLLYGLFLLVGAFFGWKAGSKPSLIMGIASSVFVFFGTALMTVNVKHGFLALSLISGALTFVFLARLLKTQKIMPSGMLLLVTVAFFLFCIFRYLRS
ncbi:MAG: TMEM14 family protein [Candidatus Omnitrophica bacterium]|nr:TMEM14 family protein [Candidatus Omnitrophota bacterium]